MTTYSLSRTLRTLAFAFVAAGFLATPFTAGAASKRPSCELSVTTPSDETTIRNDEEQVIVQVGDIVEIAWEGKNATKVVGPDGDETDLSGSTRLTVAGSETYSYIFSSGSRKETCMVDLAVVRAAFAEDPFLTKSTKPTITGTAEGIKAVRVRIESEDEGKKPYVTKEVKVKNEKWRSKVSKKLKDGTYTLTLLGPKSSGNQAIASSTLVIGDTKSAPKADTTLVVSAVPLLSGGTARANGSIPLSYLQVTNMGSKPATLTGFTVKQNGAASTDGIVMLSTVDDKGGSRAQTNGSRPFSKGVALAPTVATLAPGEIRLFTIKAQIDSSVSSYLGSALMIDVIGLETNAKVSGMFPIRGTTWTFGY